MNETADPEYIETPFGMYALGSVVEYGVFPYAANGIPGVVERDGVRAFGEWAKYFESQDVDPLCPWEGMHDLIVP